MCWWFLGRVFLCTKEMTALNVCFFGGVPSVSLRSPRSNETPEKLEIVDYVRLSSPSLNRENELYCSRTGRDTAETYVSISVMNLN
jgi:hypothetical protein